MKIINLTFCIDVCWYEKVCQWLCKFVVNTKLYAYTIYIFLTVQGNQVVFVFTFRKIKKTKVFLWRERRVHTPSHTTNYSDNHTLHCTRFQCHHVFCGWNSSCKMWMSVWGILQFTIQHDIKRRKTVINPMKQNLKSIVNILPCFNFSLTCCFP